MSSFPCQFIVVVSDFIFSLQHIKMKFGCFMMAESQKTCCTRPVHVLFAQTRFFLSSLVFTVIFSLHSQFFFSRTAGTVLPVVSAVSLCFQIVFSASSQTPFPSSVLLFIFSSSALCCFRQDSYRTGF